MWPPLRQRRTPTWHPLSGCPVTRLPCYPAGWIGAKTGGYPLTGNLSNSLEQPLVSVPSGSALAGRHNSARPQQHRRVASSPSGRGLHSLAQVSTVKSPAHIAPRPRPPAGESRCQVSKGAERAADLSRKICQRVRELCFCCTLRPATPARSMGASWTNSKHLKRHILKERARWQRRYARFSK